MTRRGTVTRDQDGRARAASMMLSTQVTHRDPSQSETLRLAGDRTRHGFRLPGRRRSPTRTRTCRLTQSCRAIRFCAESVMSRFCAVCFKFRGRPLVAGLRVPQVADKVRSEGPPGRGAGPARGRLRRSAVSGAGAAPCGAHCRPGMPRRARPTPAESRP